MCINNVDPRKFLAALPGLKMVDLGTTRRLGVELPADSPHFDLERIRQHDLNRANGKPMVPGISGTVTVNECAGTMHLSAFEHPDLCRLLDDVRIMSTSP